MSQLGFLFIAIFALTAGCKSESEQSSIRFSAIPLTSTQINNTAGNTAPLSVPSNGFNFSSRPTNVQTRMTTASTLPVVELTINGETAVIVKPGTLFTLQWSTSNATSCKFKAGTSPATEFPPNTSGTSQAPAPPALQFYLYVLTCSNASGVTSKAAVVVGEYVIFPPVIPPSSIRLGSPISAGATGNKVYVADFNCDGKDDLFQFTPDGRLFAQINNGRSTSGWNFGSPIMVGQTGNQVMFSRLNGDRCTDLVQMYPNQSFIGQIGNGQSFAAPVSLGATGNQIFFTDINGDGFDDLIQVNPNKKVTIQYNNKALGFGSPEYFGFAPYQRFYFADLNGDGRMDLVHFTEQGFLYLQRRGDGTLFLPAERLGQTGNDVLFGDFDGDGRADLLQKSLSGAMFIQLNSGDM